MSSNHLFLHFLVSFITRAHSSTHWVVTEDGRVQAQVDSIFHMKRPYDLIALMKQEERAELIESLKKELMAQKLEIDRGEDKETDVEEKMYADDPDCQMAGQKLPDFDLYVSTVLRLDSVGIRAEEYVDKSEPAVKEPLQPDCNSFYPLEFSMMAFEHLQGMAKRLNMSMGSEIGLVSNLLEHESLERYGHLVARALASNNTSWVLYNMATYYWRIRGNAPKATECVRLALHFSPRDYKDVALVNLGNILHRSRYSVDAAIVLHAALDHNHTNPVTHFTLGNVYAVLRDYNSSVMLYDNTLRLEPGSEAGRKRKYAVRCHQKVEQALEAQHESLQRTLSELRRYQEQQKYWIEQQEKLISEQAPLESKLESRLHYEEYKIRGSHNGRGQDCFQYQQNGHTFMSCNMRNDRVEKPDQAGELKTLLHALLKDLEDQPVGEVNENFLPLQVETLSEQVAKKGTKTCGSSPESHKPNKSPKYTADSIKEPPAFTLSKEECQMVGGLPNWKELPTVFLPPENLGFDVEKMLGDLIGLSRRESHPLPWYPPICEKLNVRVSRYDDLPTFRDREKYTTRIADTDVKDELLSYSGAPAASEAEIGQRIVTALNKNSGPAWLLNNLAALYWRVHGNAYNALECLRRSLLGVPAEYAHTVQLNAAALLFKLGSVEEALHLAALAYDNNQYEPSTNFLLGNLYYTNGDYMMAAKHYEQVLKVERGHMDASNYRQIIMCRLEYQESVKELMCTQVSDEEKMTAGSNIICTSSRCSSPEEGCETTIKCLPTTNENGHHVLLNEGTSYDVELRGCVEVDESHTDKISPKGPEKVQTENIDPDSRKVLLKVGIPNKKIKGEEREVEDPVVQDDPLPDVLLRVREKIATPLPPLEECKSHKKVNWRHFTSTWLSVSAKNLELEDYLTTRPASDVFLQEPFCMSVPVSLPTLDHLQGVKHRHQLHFAPEAGLKEAFLTMTKKPAKSVAQMATWLAESLAKNSSSWVLSTVASLYWRVVGKADLAIECTRHALHHAPPKHRDIPLVSLANLLFGARLHNDALIVVNMALELSPNFVIIHFTMANIYAAKGDLERAVSFYQSTLALQETFEPARERLRAIHCSFMMLQTAMDREQFNSNS